MKRFNEMMAQIWPVAYTLLSSQWEPQAPGGGKKMSPKTYGLIWTVFLFTIGFLFLTGYLTPVSLVVSGFVAFGLVFMGMMNVLPVAVTHPESSSFAWPRMASIRPYINKGQQYFRELLTPSGVEIRKPKFP